MSTPSPTIEPAVQTTPWGSTGALLRFTNEAQSVVGGHALGDLTPASVVLRLTEATRGLQSAPDIVVARSVAAAVCLKLFPAFTDINVPALRGLLSASSPQAIAHCLGDLVGPQRPLVGRETHGTALTCTRLVEAIRTHATNASFTLAKAAATCRVSKWHAAHVLRACRNSTFRDELRIARVRRATELITLEDALLKEVAFRCGYGNNGSLFARHFRKTTGLSPTAFRQQLQVRRRRS